MVHVVSALRGDGSDTGRLRDIRPMKVVFLSDGTVTDDLTDMGWGALTAKDAQRVTLTFVAPSLGRLTSLGEVTSEIEPFLAGRGSAAGAEEPVSQEPKSTVSASVTG